MSLGGSTAGERRFLAADRCELITGVERCERNRLKAGSAATQPQGKHQHLIYARICVSPVTVIKHFFHHYDVKLGREGN